MAILLSQKLFLEITGTCLASADQCDFFVVNLSDKAIDEYASLRNKAAESKEEAANIDHRLEAIVERMLEK